MPRTTGSALIKKAIRTATEQLAKMPASPEVVALKGVLSTIEDEVERWTGAPPAAAEREKMMKDVMALHLAIAKLAPRRTR